MQPSNSRATRAVTSRSARSSTTWPSERCRPGEQLQRGARHAGMAIDQRGNRRERDEADAARPDRDRGVGIGLAVEYRDVIERGARTEHAQHMLAAVGEMS